MRSWLAVAAAATVVACAPAGSPRVTAAPDPSTPLEARLFPPYYGQVALRLSKPAYVALFEVVPGRGVSLLYPQAGAGWQGTTEVWVPMRYNPQRWMYTTSAASAAYGYGVAGTSGYEEHGVTAGGLAAPRYLFLVASERPLAVDQFQGDPTSMRSYLGHVSYASYEPYDVMERLAYAILPFASEESWVADVYVDWGYDWGYGAGPAATSAFASYQRVRCADGSLGYARYLTGWGFTDASCSIAGYVDPVPDGPIVGPQPDDSSVVAPPGSGRSRAGTSADDGRRRADEPVSATAGGAAAAQAAARVRQLRADAERTDFRDQVDGLLRQSVRTRQRTDRLLGYDEPSVWTETRPGTDASARARAEERRRRPGESALDRADGERRDATARAAERAAERERLREVRSRGASSGSGSTGEPRSRAGSDPAGGSGGSSTRRATAEPSGSSGSSGSSSSGSSGSSSGGRSRVPPG